MTSNDQCIYKNELKVISLHDADAKQKKYPIFLLEAVTDGHACMDVTADSIQFIRVPINVLQLQ